MAIRDEKKVRLPTVAGQFYSDNALRLRRQLMVLEAEQPAPAEIAGHPVVASIVPHAGYMFSLPTAFETIRAAAGKPCRRVILLSPSHNVGFHGAALSPYDAMRTPFGDVAVDRMATDRLAALARSGLSIREEVHVKEHGLEVQLPILQYFFGSVEVLPIICGRMETGFIDELGALLAGEFRPDTLLLASSDFCHYGDAFAYRPFRDEIRLRLHELDGGAINRILDRDRDGFLAYCESTGITICGAQVIALALAILDVIDRRRGWKGELVDYTTSGDVTGDYEHCVSYAGINFRS